MSDDQPAGTIVWKDLTVENADVIREVVGWRHEPVDMDIDSSVRRAVELGGHLVDGPAKRKRTGSA